MMSNIGFCRSSSTSFICYFVDARNFSRLFICLFFGYLYYFSCVLHVLVGVFRV
jgi:hypothetical protein